MSKIESKKIIRRYAEKLIAENYSFSAIYLFGSHAKGKTHKWSDIDVAVVSKKLKRNYDKNRFLLWHLGRKIDTRIEPYGFTPENFEDNANPIAYEIKKTGIRMF